MIKKALCAIMAFCMLFTMIGVTGAVAVDTADVVITVDFDDEFRTIQKKGNTYENTLKFTVTISGVDPDSEFIQCVGPLYFNWDADVAQVPTYTQAGDVKSLVTQNSFFNINAVKFDVPGELRVVYGTMDYIEEEEIALTTEGYLQLTDDALLHASTLDITVSTSGPAGETGVGNTGNEHLYTFSIPQTQFSVEIPDNRPEMTDVEVLGELVEYDGQVYNVVVTGAPEGSTITYTCNGEAFEGTKAAGEYEVTAKVTHPDYKPFTDTATLVISPAELTIEGLDAEDRAYNGTTTVGLIGELTGVVAGDDVTFPREATISSKNIGTYTVELPDLTGADVANYEFNVAAPDVVISAKEITATAERVEKVYDATTAFDAVVNIEGLVDGDDVTVDWTENALASKNADTYTGSVDVSISGADAANYTLASSAVDVEVVVSPKEITATVDGVDRVYDATTAFEALVTFDGEIDGDDVEVHWTEVELDSKDAGTRTGSVELSLTGADAANYTLASSAVDVEVEVSAKEITATVEGTDRAYDGTTAFAATATLDGVIDGDVVATTATGTLTSKNVGSYADGVVVVELTGDDAENYVLAADTFNDVAVNITVKDVTATVTATDRVYDATTVFEAIATIAGLVDGDEVTVDCAENELDSKNAGTHTGSVVVSIAGADAANYNLTNPEISDVAVVISPATLTVSGITAIDRKTDGTTVVTLDATNALLAGIIDGDVVTAVYPESGTVESASAGSDKVVTITGITLEGADAANYTVTAPTDVKVNITSAYGNNYRPSSSTSSGPKPSTPVEDDKKDEEDKDDKEQPGDEKDEDLTKATAEVSLKEKASDIRFVETDKEGKFAPDASATRNEVVNALNEVLDIKNATGDCELTDIEGAENADIVELFTKANIIAGYEDGTFRGEATITRAEVVKLLAVALGVEIKEYEEDKFTDVADHWSSDYVNSFVELGYILGYPDNTFRPDDEISKAEVVVIINRIINKNVDEADNSEVEIVDLDETHWAYKYVMAAVK